MGPLICRALQTALQDDKIVPRVTVDIRSVPARMAKPGSGIGISG